MSPWSVPTSLSHLAVHLRCSIGRQKYRNICHSRCLIKEPLLFQVRAESICKAVEMSCFCPCWARVGKLITFALKCHVRPVFLFVGKQWWRCLTPCHLKVEGKSGGEHWKDFLRPVYRTPDIIWLNEALK